MLSRSRGAPAGWAVWRQRRSRTTAHLVIEIVREDARTGDAGLNEQECDARVCDPGRRVR